ncbi:cytochrome P450 [Sporodiniella umbellata]|nr:cytochrome P450 [Sporodiniella umbellata]
MEHFQDILSNLSTLQKTLGVFSAIAAMAATTVVATKTSGMLTSTQYRGGKEIPTPRGSYPLIGHLLSLRDRLGLRVTQWHKELGPIFKIKVGSQNWVFLGEPEIAHEILFSKGSATSGRPCMTFLSDVVSPNDTGILCADYSPAWKTSRKAIIHITSPKSVDSMTDVIAYEAEQLMIDIKEQIEVDPYLESDTFSTLSSTNIIARMAFGVKGAKSTEDKYFK